MGKTHGVSSASAPMDAASQRKRNSELVDWRGDTGDGKPEAAVADAASAAGAADAVSARPTDVGATIGALAATMGAPAIVIPHASVSSVGGRQ